MSDVKVTLFSQFLALVDRNEFDKIVKKHGTDKHSKGIDSWTHFVAMIFMHLADANTLRDISKGLLSATGNLSHLGVERAPSKSAMSYINMNRSYKLFEDLYFQLLDKYEPSIAHRRLYARHLKRQIFIMDSTVIPLSLSLFDWAKYRTHKGAIKLHAVLDYDTGLPSYAVITEGRKHDVKVAKQTAFPAGSVVVADRAYLDYDWLYNLDSTGAFFVTRLKNNADIAIVQSFLTNDRHDHILSDEDIQLMGFYSKKRYPEKLRLVRVHDKEKDRTLLLLTNNMSWTADTVSQLYKARWDIESFFKHIKQLLKVKTFVGTSANAVRIQMWCAMITILLLKYLKQKANYKWHLSNLVCFIRINLFVKINLWKWIDKPLIEKANPPPQLLLF